MPIFAAGSLSITSTSIPTSVTQGDSFTLTLSVSGSEVSDVKGSLTTPSGLSCAPTGTQDISLSGSGTGTASWTCSASVAGDYTSRITTSITATDSGTGGSLSDSGQTGLSVLSPASLTASSSISSSSVAAGSSVTLTVGVNNVGDAATTYSISLSCLTGTTCSPSSVASKSIAASSLDTNTFIITGGTVGSYTITATVSGGSGQTTTTSQSLTVTSTGGNNQNPSTGGGGGLVNTTPKNKQKFTFMDKNTVTKMKLFDRALGIKEISIEVHNKAHNVTITITKLAGQPASVTHSISGTVFQWINITHDNLTDDNVKSLSMRFNVSRAWLINNSFSPDDVRLQRYSSGWTKLVTARIGETSGEYEYEATSPGLSVFAITAEKAASAPTIACGNNVREGAEQCDGTDLAGQTCIGLGFEGGMLLCSGCMFDTSACISATTSTQECGDGICGSGEETTCPDDCRAIEVSKAVSDYGWLITLVVIIIVVILGYFYYHGKKHFRKL